MINGTILSCLGILLAVGIGGMMYGKKNNDLIFCGLGAISIFCFIGALALVLYR